MVDEWLALDTVAAHMGADVGDLTVEQARAAAARYVRRVRPDVFTATGDLVDPADSADLVLGATMLAARLHSRRGSPGGIASFGEFGVANVARFDPDVDRLLGVGRSARPVIG